MTTEWKCSERKNPVTGLRTTTGFPIYDLSGKTIGVFLHKHNSEKAVACVNARQELAQAKAKLEKAREAVSWRCEHACHEPDFFPRCKETMPACETAKALTALDNPGEQDKQGVWLSGEERDYIVNTMEGCCTEDGECESCYRTIDDCSNCKALAILQGKVSNGKGKGA